MAFEDWDVNPNLNATKPGINWAEGMPPHAINNSARQMMADLANWGRGVTPVLTPEMFGAVGDGVTNDTVALNALADAVNALGGGTVDCKPGAIYLVGIQTLNGTESGSNYLWDPHKILQFEDLTQPFVFNGNGAIIRCAPGLKYGTFNADGTVLSHGMPYFTPGSLASPYLNMIGFTGCSGGIAVRDIELDGNIDAAVIGGGYGDTGWQIPNTGLDIHFNSGPTNIQNVTSYHHGLDGMQVKNNVLSDHARTPSLFVNVHCHHNMRQGASITGGSGLTFINCQFNYTGKDLAQYSNPGAGIDIEGEGGLLCRHIVFINCQVMCNSGVGAVGDAGNSRDVTWHNCYFVGDTNWALWPNNPRWRFYDCVMVGGSTHAYPNADASLACQFHNCWFTDDTTMSPTGLIYNSIIYDLGGTGGNNVLFKRCRFNLLGATTLLPFSTDAIYEDCIMTQTSATSSFPRGKWRGLNKITCPTNAVTTTPTSPFEGSIVINGVGHTRVVKSGVTPGSIAAGGTYVVGFGGVANASALIADGAMVASFDPVVDGIAIDKIYAGGSGDLQVRLINVTGGPIDPGTINVRATYIPTKPAVI